MDFSNNTTHIILAIIGLFAVGGLVFKFVSNRSKKRSDSNKVDVRDTKIGGDFTGRDRKS